MRGRIQAGVLVLALTLCVHNAQALDGTETDRASIDATGNAWLMTAYYHSWPLAPPLRPPPDDGIAAFVLRPAA